jgi:hypothetical protein
VDEPLDSIINQAWSKSELSKDQPSRLSKSPPKTISEMKAVSSRLHNPTASIKGKYGSRFSSMEEENRRKSVKSPPPDTQNPMH